MRKVRGFILKQRVRTLLRPFSYRRLINQPFSRLVNWTNRLTTKAKAIVTKNLEPGNPVLGKPVPVPKGHMAVYVGRKDGGDVRRVLVPVVYFNHPLFGDLLKETENEYGFDHPGGITLPCRASEFERVQTRIKRVDNQDKGSKFMKWTKGNQKS